MLGAEFCDRVRRRSGRDKAGVRRDLPPASERELVAAAAAGDAATCEQLVEAFLPSIAGVASIYRSTPARQRQARPALPFVTCVLQSKVGRCCSDPPIARRAACFLARTTAQPFKHLESHRAGSLVRRRVWIRRPAGQSGRAD
jgi:hypothetical protein